MDLLDPYSSDQRPCCACGLTDTLSLRPLDSPFEGSIFDYSQNALSKARHIVDDGQSRIHTIDQAIQRLQKHRDQIHRVVLNHQAFLAPIARIPDDVMMLVFEQTMGWDWDPSEGSLWKAAAVCRRWRSLALSSRSLWSRIALDLLNNVGEERALLLCRRVQLQLDRSDQEPLEINLNLGTLEHYRGCSYVQATVQRILSSLSRCVALEIAIQTEEPLELLNTLDPPSSLSRLSFLTITEWTNHTYSALTLDSSLLADMPAVRSLVLFSTHLPIMGIPIPQFFASVTTLNIQHCKTYPAEIVAVLCATSNVKTLLLHSAFSPHWLRSRYGSGGPLIAQVANLPSLADLDVYFQPLSENGGIVPSDSSQATYLIREVVRHIHTPNIKKLRIYSPSEEDVLAVQTCISDASPAMSLTKFTIVAPEESSLPPLPGLLSRTPALGYLRVFGPPGIATGNTCNIDPLLNALAWTSRLQNASAEAMEERPCPGLWNMHLCRCKMGLTTLRRMIATRRKPESEGDEAVPIVGRIDPPSKLLDEVYVDYPTFTDSAVTNETELAIVL